MQEAEGTSSTGIIEPESFSDAAVVKAVRELFSELIKSSKIFRTYPRDNSMSIAAVDKMAKMLNDYTEGRGDLEVFVERDQLLFGSETVLQDGNARCSIPLKLDRAGVRRLVFKPGIERQEVVDLLEVLTEELDEESLDDDVVTLMWQKQFTHVKPYVLDELTEDEKFDSEKAGNSDQSAGEAGEEPEGEPALPSNICKPDASVAARLAQDCLSTKSKLTEPTAEEIRTLRREVEAQDSCDLSQKLANVLFEVIIGSREESTSANVCTVLGQLVVMRMREGNFAGAAALTTQIKELARKPGLQSEQSRLIEEMTVSLFTTDLVEELRDVLISNPEAPLTDLEKLAAYFPEQSLPKLVGLMALERDRSGITAVLMKVFSGRAALLLEPLICEEEGLRPRVMEMVEKLATEGDVAALAGAIPMLEGAFRLRLIKTIARFRTPDVLRLLEALVSDEDVEVRRLAIKQLGRFKGEVDSTQIRTQVAAKDFLNRSIEEKKGMLNALAQAEQEGAVELLSRMIDSKGWFESDRHLETRACAVLALGEIEGPQGHEALEKYAQDKSESIRGAARLALSRRRMEPATTR